MRSVLIISLLLFLTACGGSASVEHSNASSPAAAATPALSKTPLPIVDQARTLIGLDNGGKILAEESDIKVKRARYLLENLAVATNEDTATIAAETDAASSRLEDQYGKRVARLELLEDMNRIISDPIMKSKKLNYRDALMFLIQSKYAK